jgi:membrane-associated phospholipid phosphatase
MFGHRALFYTACATVLVGVILGAFPSIDFDISDFFEDTTPSFVLRLSPLAKHLRSIGMILPTCVAVIFILALLVKIIRPQIRLPVDTRSLIAVLMTFLLGPTLLVNAVLKQHWGRERPETAVEEVEKGQAFAPWWYIGGPCHHNCSFVSGEVSSATVLVAAAAVLPAAVSGVAMGVAVAFTVLIASLRLAFGGHFLSDVLLAALFTHMIAIVMLRIMHDPRWGPGRPGAIEAWLARRGRPQNAALSDGA